MRLNPTRGRPGAADSPGVSSRVKQKAEARERRLQAEGEREAQQRRRRTMRLAVFGATLLAAIVAIVLVAGGGGDSGSDESGDRVGGVEGAAETNDLFKGIPQSGTSLGNPKAKVVMTEYADLQCPFCAQYSNDVLPRIIEEYVRPGKVRLELRLLRFLGPDSNRGAQAAHAAGDGDRMWQFADVWYRNQGPENSGYADDDFITGIAEAAGVSPDKAVEAAGSSSYDADIEGAEQEADLAGVDSTPSFVVGRKPGQGVKLEISELTFEEFEQALAAELE
jgi:protein-disulfide isomerase